MSRLDRRRFLARAAAALAALAIPRWARAQAADTLRSMPAPEAAFDTLRTTLPDSADTRRGEPASVTLAVAGDTVLGYNLQDHFDAQLAAGRTREELFPLYFAGVRTILDAADLALVNLECPFTERGEKVKKNFNFRARHELVEVLTRGGVDVVTLANNHIRDFGDASVLDTIETLDRAGIAHFGAGRNLKAARKPRIVERNGLRIGFVGHYFQAPPDMFEPREVYATRRRAGPAGCFEDRDCIFEMVKADVEKLVAEVDVAIPYFHWGKEGSYDLRDYQVELAHLCVDLGCKAVLGAHPHRLQGVEIYRGAPIFYSLGNFVYGGIKEPKDRLTAVARMKLSREGMIEADLVPCWFTTWPDAPFQPVVLRDAEREEALRRIAELSRPLPQTLAQLAPYLGDQQPAAPE